MFGTDDTIMCVFGVVFCGKKEPSLPDMVKKSDTIELHVLVELITCPGRLFLRICEFCRKE